MLKITFFGHSAFQFESEETTILIDPFLGDNPLCDMSPDDVNPETILLTHAHADHVGDTVSIAKRTGASIVTTLELANYLTAQGVENVNGGNFGGTLAFKGGTAKIFPAWHSSTYGPDFDAPGIPAGFIIEFSGKTIYFSGDTALFSDMKLAGEEGIDIAVLPIGDHFTMGPKDAVRAVKFIEPGVVIPCHFNTFPPIQQDPNEFKQMVESQTSATVVVIDPNSSYTAS